MIPKLQTLDSRRLFDDTRLSMQNSNDPNTTAKQVETIFMAEFLKIMLEQTAFAKDKTVSTYMPYITSEIAKTFSERGIGIGDFVIRSNRGIKG